MGVYPKACRYYSLSPRRMSGGKAGLKVSFLVRQEWSMGSLHLEQVASQPLFPGPWFAARPLCLGFPDRGRELYSCSAWSRKNSKVQLLRCTLPSDQKGDHSKPGYVTHSV